MQNTIFIISAISAALIIAVVIPLLIAQKLKLAIGHITRTEEPTATASNNLRHEIIAPISTMTHATQQWRIEIEETPEEEEFSLEDGEWLPMAESILLKQAEEVVDEVQDTINHMASLPVNPEELTSKLNAILSNYSIFKNTEYFQAINNYVILAAKRDCDIELSDATVNQLWL